MAKTRVFLLALLSLFCFTGCNAFKAWFATEFQRNRLVKGIGGLGTQSLSMIANELGKKFDEPNVASKIVESIDPLEYGRGEVTKTIENLEINYEEKVVYEDCQGDVAKWAGRLRVNKAEQVIYGRLTHSDKPIIPDHDRVMMKINVDVMGKYIIKFDSKRDTYLELTSGNIQFDMHPRFAQTQTGDKKGLRLSVTSNSRFKNIKMTNVHGILHTPDVVLPFHIAESDYEIQVGEGEDGKENYISGKMDIFGSKHEISSDGTTLDPNYDREKFKATYACKNDLDGKVTYTNVRIEDKLGPSAAALTTLTLGIVLKEFEKNYICGMSSPSFLKTTELSAKPGSIGDATSRLEDECLVKLDNVQTEPDCFGRAHVISGRARIVDASKTFNGLLAYTDIDYEDAITQYENRLKSAVGAKAKAEAAKLSPKPAIPNSRQPVAIDFTAELKGIEIRDVCVNEGSINHPEHCSGKKDLKPIKFLADGKAKGFFKPVLAKSINPEHEGYGACSMPIPAANASVTVDNLKVSVCRGDSKLNMLLHQGSYFATSGKIDNEENRLSGKIDIGRIPVSFITEGANYIALDPSYNLKSHEDSYLFCNKDKIQAVNSDEDCRIWPMLGLNIGRTLVLNSGGLIRIPSGENVENNFRSKSNLWKSEYSDNNNTITIKGGSKNIINLSEDKYSDINSSTNGIGVVTDISGTLYGYDAKMTRKGINIGYSGTLGSRWSGVEELYVRPTAPDSTSLNVSAKLSNFSTKMKEGKKGDYKPHLEIIAGELSTYATPIMGVHIDTIEDNYKSYSIKTPVVNFREIRFSGSVLLRIGHRNLPFYIDSTDISAHSGYYDGKGNYIVGKIRMAPYPDANVDVADLEYHDIKIPMSTLLPENQPFDQEKFDDSYRGTENLRKVISPLKKKKN